MPSPPSAKRTSSRYKYKQEVPSVTTKPDIVSRLHSTTHVRTIQLVPKFQEQQLREREERLKAKDLELQDSILKFARFVEENTQKRKRLAGKAVEEKAAEEAARSRREVVLSHIHQAKEAVNTLRSQLKDVQRYAGVQAQGFIS